MVYPCASQFYFLKWGFSGYSIHGYVNVMKRSSFICSFSFNFQSTFIPSLKHEKSYHKMSRIARKPDFCLGENKGADQLRGIREADQRLYFRYSDSTIPLLLKSEISSFWLFSELVQAGLCRTWSETPKTGFLASRLINIIERMVASVCAL